MGLHVELARFPIVVCRLTATATMGAETATMGAELGAACDSYLEELARHRGIFVCVHDWTSADVLPQESWQTVFDGAVLAPFSRGRCVAQALAVTSPSLRGFATGRVLAQELPYPVRVAASLEAALAWCAWQLRRSEPQAV